MERWEATLFTSSQEENTIAEFCKLIIVWWSDTALRHVLTAYHQYATVMTKHQKTVSSYHTLVIMSLPLGPFKNQTFQVWLSLVYSVVCSQTDCIYLQMNRCDTEILVYKAAMHDFLNILLWRSYRNSCLVFERKECWCLFHILCV